MKKEKRDLLIAWACLVFFLLELIYAIFGKDRDIMLLITGVIGTLSGLLLVIKSYKLRKKDDK